MQKYSISQFNPAVLQILLSYRYCFRNPIGIILNTYFIPTGRFNWENLWDGQCWVSHTGSSKVGHFCLNPKFFPAGLHTKCQDKTGTIVHRKKLNAISFSVTFILCMLAGWGFQGHSSNENRTHPSSSITKVTQALDLKPHLSYDLISEFSFITSTAESSFLSVLK